MQVRPYKEIRPEDQPNLGLARTIRIALDGVRYRLFRAAVTVVVIAVAIAFLMNILSESLIKRRLASDARRDLAERREVHVWATRLSRPSRPQDLLAAGSAIPSAFLEAIPPEARAPFQESARNAAQYIAFFDGLNYDDRRTLVHTAQGTDIFDALSDRDRLDAFRNRLAEMRTVRFVSTPDQFETFLAKWPTLKKQLQQIMSTEVAALAKLTKARGSQTVFQALTDPGGAFVDTARQVGFPIHADKARRLAEQAEAVLDRQVIERALSLLECRQHLARHFDLLPADIAPSQLWQYLETPRNAEAFLNTLSPLQPNLSALAPAKLVSLAHERRDEMELDRTVRLTQDAGGGWLGLGERMGWLLIVSMLVCAIGISNAMLMTVTERFREIATMKCLGALDGFIMLLFVIESCFLGLAGGFIGSLLGNLIGYGRMTTFFGPSVFSTVPLSELLTATAVAVGVGIVLAAIAAIYPSLKAARLAPMEAMRIE